MVETITVIQELVESTKQETEARLATKAILDKLYEKIQSLSSEEAGERLAIIEITLREIQAKLEVVVQILAADHGMDKKKLESIFNQVREQIHAGVTIEATQGSKVNIGRDVKSEQDRS